MVRGLPHEKRNIAVSCPGHDSLSNGTPLPLSILLSLASREALSSNKSDNKPHSYVLHTDFDRMRSYYVLHDVGLEATIHRSESISSLFMKAI